MLYVPFFKNAIEICKSCISSSLSKFFCKNQGWNDLNQLIKISDLNRDLNQMIFFYQKNYLI